MGFFAATDIEVTIRFVQLEDLVNQNCSSNKTLAQTSDLLMADDSASINTQASRLQTCVSACASKDPCVGIKYIEDRQQSFCYFINDPTKSASATRVWKQGAIDSPEKFKSICDPVASLYGGTALMASGEFLL